MEEKMTRMLNIFFKNVYVAIFYLSVLVNGLWNTCGFLLVKMLIKIKLFESTDIMTNNNALVIVNVCYL